jgi:cephalosporin hydroxylase
MQDLVNNGKVITVDIVQPDSRPIHKRIKYLVGSSISEDTVSAIKNQIQKKDSVMVILNSDHHKAHVLAELRIYSKFVTKGSYIIVEDTIFNGHPVEPDFGPGPMEAVEEFLNETNDFVIDKDKEKFCMTFNPHGYLRRIK